MPDVVKHPNQQQLAAFDQGLLPKDAAITIANHLADCPTCTAAIAGLEPDPSRAKVRSAELEESTAPPLESGTLIKGRRNETRQSPAPPLAAGLDLPPDLANHAKFRIIRELGRGGMGVVYLAEHKFMSKQVALKVLNPAVLDSPDALPRFLKEVRAAAQLDHANIVHAHDAEQAGNLHFLMMEFVEGTDLAKLVKQKGRLTPSIACYFGRQAALGLQHAHEQGMTHRDIKPHNLMVTPKGQIKVLDFGLARVRGEGRTGGGLTAAEAFMGTPEYVAPEQATDARYADIRSDIYSLGCTLYYLLTGRPPFREETVVKTVMAQINQSPQPLHEIRSEIPAELSAIVDKMLAKDPAKRYQTPGEVAQLLTLFIKPGAKGGAPAALPPSVASPAPRTVLAGEKPGAAPAWRRPSLIAGAAVAVLVLIMGGLLASGVFKVKTKDGIIVLENLPSDAEVTVDGGIVTLQTIDGKPYSISIAPGKRKRLQVKKDGFTTFGEEVDIDAGGRRTINVRLEPLPIVAGKPIRKETAPPASAGSDLVLDLGAGVKMPLVRIKAGSFLMGAPGSDKDAFANEKPQHEVKISRDFFLGKYVVTRHDFARFIEEDGYKTEAERDGRGGWGFNSATNAMEVGAQFTWRNPGFEQTEQHPVVNVSWNDAQAFCRWLTKKAGKHCELPTEAQWEYACRAGTTTRYFTGNDPESLRGFANVRDQTLFVKEIGGTSNRPYFSFSDGFVFTSPVEAMKSNPWGLHDMTGNVWQWCSDWYDERYYGNSSKVDPQGPNGGAARVVRGGSWSYTPGCCRAGFRLMSDPLGRFGGHGFRVSVRLD